MNKIKKITQMIIIATTILLVSGVNTYALQNTKLVTGTTKLVQDGTAVLTGISAAITALLVIYFLIRRSSAEEMDQKKWNDRLKVTLICGIGITVASGVIAVILSYYV